MSPQLANSLRPAPAQIPRRQSSPRQPSAVDQDDRQG